MGVDYFVVVSATSAVLVAALGWLVGHKLSSRRNRENTRREVRRRYLMEATETLLDSAMTGSVTKNHQAVQRVVFLIQVYGDQQLVVLCE